MNQYHQFHLELLKQTYNHLLSYSAFNSSDINPQDQEFLDNFIELIEYCENFTDQYIEKGQQICLHWVRAYPDLVPVLPRDLLWFFGGDCLHYMPDEEINQFQQLDELRYDAEAKQQAFNYGEQRTAFFKLEK